MDLADFSGYPGSTDFRYALVCTDVFTKFGVAFPLKSKTPAEVATAVANALDTYGLVKNVYTDPGGEFTNQPLPSAG